MIPHRKNTPWMPEHNDYIRAHYPAGNLRDLADALGTSTDAVRCQAGKLGIHRIKEHEIIAANNPDLPKNCYSPKSGHLVHQLR